jgi:murein DD-endopeptidase MepM/ murein hydrolase activator NlpD
VTTRPASGRLTAAPDVPELSPVPLTRCRRSARHAATPAFRPAAAVPAVLVLALTGAFAGLATTTSAAEPALAAASIEHVAVLAAARSSEARASRDRSAVVLTVATGPGLVAAAAEPAPVRSAPPAGAVPLEAARPSDGVLTSPFGPRWGRLHAGLDFATGIGAPMRAAADGTVAAAGAESGYGTTVRMHHPDGAETVYAHLSVAEVAPGQPVAAGQNLGREGSTGQSTGPHLHFEVRYAGAPVDPAAWLLARGVVL